jgi:hypothetical protein
VPSIEKVTVPFGLLTELFAETTAVKVTSWPALEGLSDEVSVVVVGGKLGAVTVWVGNGPLLEATLASPL